MACNKGKIGKRKIFYMVNSLIARLEKKMRIDLSYIIPNGFWAVLQQVLIIIIGIIFIAIFSRYSTKEVFGQFQFILSLFAFFSIASITGLNMSVVHSVARGYEGSYKEAVLVSLKWSLLGLLGIVIIGIYYLFLKQVNLGLALMFAAILFPFFYAFNTWKSYYQGKSQFKTLTKISVAQNLLVILLTSIVILFKNNNLILITIVYIGATGLSNLYFYLKSLKKVNNNFKDGDTIKYGWFLTFVEAWVIIGDNIDKIAVGAILGAENLAIYTIISMVPIQAKGVFKSFSSIFFPKLAQMRDNFKSIVIFHKLNIFIAFIAISFISLCYYLLVVPVSLVLFSQKYNAYYNLSKIYIILIFLSIPVSFLSYYVKAKKNKISIAITGPVFNVIKVILITVLAYKYKLIGAIVGFNLSVAVGFFLYLFCSLEGRAYRYLEFFISTFKNGFFDNVYYYFPFVKIFKYALNIRKNKSIIRQKKITESDDFHKIKRSDTIFIFGSGWSINNLTNEQWNYFKKHNTISFNWFSNGDFIPIDYYIVSEITKNNNFHELIGNEDIGKYIKNLKKPFYSKSFLFINLTSINSAFVFMDRELSKRNFKFFKNKINNFLHFPHSFNKIFHGNASLNDAIHIAYLLGYKKIVLAGVDLYDRRYFWLGEEETRDVDLKRGASYRDKHNYASRAVDIIGKTRKKLAKKGVNLYIINNESLLAKCLPVYENNNS